MDKNFIYCYNLLCYYVQSRNFRFVKPLAVLCRRLFFVRSRCFVFSLFIFLLVCSRFALYPQHFGWMSTEQAEWQWHRQPNAEYINKNSSFSCVLIIFNAHKCTENINFFFYYLIKLCCALDRYRFVVFELVCARELLPCGNRANETRTTCIWNVDG